MRILESYNSVAIVRKGFPDRENIRHKGPKGVKGREQAGRERYLLLE